MVVFGTFDGKKQLKIKELIHLDTCDYVIANGDYGIGQKHFAIYYDEAN